MSQFHRRERSRNTGCTPHSGWCQHYPFSYTSCPRSCLNRPTSVNGWVHPTSKLIEPACERQRVGRVETMLTVVGFWLPVAGGFDSAVRFAHVLAQPALFFLKLVEPACERQRVGRVETMVRVSGVLGSGLCTGCRWWFRLSRSLRSRAGSTSFGEGGFMGWLNRLRRGFTCRVSFWSRDSRVRAIDSCHALGKETVGQP